MRALRGVVYMTKSSGPRTELALGDTAGGSVPGGQVGFTLYTKATR